MSPSLPCLNALPFRNNRFVVTNDLYRDSSLMNIEGLREWLKTHRISFTFADDKFTPNPEIRLSTPFPPPPDILEVDGMLSKDYID